jgi:hypothetical protein
MSRAQIRASRLDLLADDRSLGGILVIGPAERAERAAREFATRVLCTGERTPCGECRPCRVGEAYPDLVALAPNRLDGEIGVDAVRDLVGAISVRPYEGERRVVLALELERATEPAQQALLKALEEPPIGTRFACTVGDDRALLPTVRSRLAAVRLPEPTPLPDETLRTGLRALGDEDLVGRLESIRRLHAHAIATGDADPNAPAPSRRTWAERRRGAEALLVQWSELARDLAAASAGSLLAIPAIDRDEVSALAGRAELPVWHAIATRVDGALTALRSGSNPELLIDLLALRWPATRRAR